MVFFGGPTDRVGDSFNFFVHPLSKLCVSGMHLHIREKHDSSEKLMNKSALKKKLSSDKIATY